MRILLAEDNKSLAKAVSAILSKNNYSVDVVGNGIDAVAYAETDIYDLIVMDIMMPKLDGISALKRIRSLRIQVPVLMLTAKATVDDKIEGLDSGANDYLTKPFDPRELLARVRVLTRGKEQTDSTLRVGNLTLSTTTYELSTDTGRVQLANKEFQLIEKFMQNPDRFFTAEQLMEQIWGYDSNSDITTIWTHISMLRGKLDSIQADYSILTKRNVGYALKQA